MRGGRPAGWWLRGLIGSRVRRWDALESIKRSNEAGARLVLLDNFDLAAMREAVRIAGDRAELEASGGVTLSSVRAIAETGVHRISIGSLTKDVDALDLSIRFVNP